MSREIFRIVFRVSDRIITAEFREIYFGDRDMKFRSVFLTLCAALIASSLVSCSGSDMNNNEATETSTSSNNSADSTNRAETSGSSRDASDSVRGGEESDIQPRSDAGSERSGMNIRMQDFGDGAEEVRQ